MGFYLIVTILLMPLICTINVPVQGTSRDTDDEWVIPFFSKRPRKSNTANLLIGDKPSNLILRDSAKIFTPLVVFVFFLIGSN